MAGEEQVTGTSVPGRHVNMENEFARTGAAPTHQIAGDAEATVFLLRVCHRVDNAPKRGERCWSSVLHALYRNSRNSQHSERSCRGCSGGTVAGQPTPKRAPLRLYWHGGILRNGGS